MANVACCNHSPASGPRGVPAGEPLAVAQKGQEPVALDKAARYVSVFGSSDKRAVPLYWAAVAPTEPACGSV